MAYRPLQMIRLLGKRTLARLMVWRLRSGSSPRDAPVTPALRRRDLPDRRLAGAA